jgi:hypothetical protein
MTMATRHRLSDDDGSLADAIPHTPAPRRYSCFADGCPMPGTITPSGSGSSVCAWHYGILPTDIPKVTRVLRDWQCVSYEVGEARRVLTGELAADPTAIRRMFAAAWERLEPLAGTWAAELKPGNVRTSKGVDRGPLFPEGYGDWAKRLERFLGARVVEVLSVRQREAA